MLVLIFMAFAFGRVVGLGRFGGQSTISRPGDPALSLVLVFILWRLLLVSDPRAGFDAGFNLHGDILWWKRFVLGRDSVARGLPAPCACRDPVVSQR